MDIEAQVTTSFKSEIGAKRQPSTVKFDIYKHENGKLTQQYLTNNKGHAKRPTTMPGSRMCLFLTAAALLDFFATGFGYSLSVLYAELVREFDTKRSVAVLVQSFYLSIEIGCGALWSYPVSVLGPTQCACIGAIIAFIGTLVSAFSLNIWMIICFLGVVAGFGNSIVGTVPYIVIVNCIGEKKRAALAFVAASISLGAFFLTFIMEQLIEKYYWNGALLIISAMVLNCVPCSFLLYFIEKDALNSSSATSNKEQGVSNNKMFNLKLLRKWQFTVLAVNAFLFSFSTLAETTFFVDLVMLKGFTRETGAWFAAIANVVNFVSKIFGVGLKLIIPKHSLIELAILMIFMILSHLIVLYFDDYTGLLSGVILNGFVVGLCTSALPGLILDILPLEDYAAGYSMYLILAGVGRFTGGYIGGSIQDLTGSYDLLLIGSIGLNSVNFILYSIVAVSVTNIVCKNGAGYVRLEQLAVD